MRQLTEGERYARMLRAASAKQTAGPHHRTRKRGENSKALPAQVIEVHIGRFAGYNGRRRFTLANGQVCQNLNSGNSRVHKMHLQR